MKNLFLILCIFLCPAISLNAQSWPPAGMIGSGTESNPWEITTPAHLEALASFVNAGNGNATSGRYYKLMNDINLSESTNWVPIGDFSSNDSTTEFRGNFNGNGKIIHNLTINHLSDVNFLGLFGSISGASIRNLGLENCNITGGIFFVGGLVGRSSNSTISNSFVMGNIVSGENFVGGLVGGSTNSVISNSYATNNVSGESFIGGLVGGSSGTISNSFALGNVFGNGDNIGGLTGYNSGFIRNSIAANDIVVSNTNTLYINRIVGEDNFGIYDNNFALSSMVVRNHNGNIPITNGTFQSGISKNANTLRSLDFYITNSNWHNSMYWNIGTPDATWGICDGIWLPFLRWQNIDNCDKFLAPINLRNAVHLNLGAIVRNTVIWGNPELRPLSLDVSAINSASDSVLSGVHNILLTFSPFVYGFKIDSTSLLFNAGTLIGLRDCDTLCLAHNPRVNNGIVDIGAFAHILPPPALILLAFNDVQIVLNPVVMNYTVHFPCGTSATTIHVEARIGNTIAINGQNVSNPDNFFVNAGFPGSKQSLDIVVANNSGDSSVIYTLYVFTPFENDLLHQVFRTMLEVVNNPIYTGGHIFTNDGYTWYINGVQQSERSGVLSLPDGLLPGATYSVWVTCASTGARNKICPLVVPILSPPLSVHPNPTFGEVTVEISTDAIIEGVPIEIYSISGVLLRTIHTTGEKTNVNLQGLPAGRYVIRYNDQFSIIVKQ